jgi:hypothetical protein
MMRSNSWSANLFGEEVADAAGTSGDDGQLTGILDGHRRRLPVTAVA